MDVDWPCPKRRRMGNGGPWWETPHAVNEEEQVMLLGLCDALSLYANGAGPCGESLPEDAAAPDSIRSTASWCRNLFGQTNRRAQPLNGDGSSHGAGTPVWAHASPGSPESTSSNDGIGIFCGGGIAESGSSACSSSTLTVAPLLTAPSSPARSSTLGTSSSGGSGVLGSGSMSGRTFGSVSHTGARSRFKGEPLLRALTQLANAAAADANLRRQLVTQCQVHASLLRLMQGPWARQHLVAERCCRLVHWLCTKAPENREILAAHRSPSTCGGGYSTSFVDAALTVAEAHPGCREVLAHALRALAALLPCPHVREELSRSQPRLLTCLVRAGERLDVAAVRSVCRWLPGISGQIRQARCLSKSGEPLPDSVATPSAGQPVALGAADCDDDVEMTDL